MQEEGSPRDPQTPRGPALGRSSPRSPPTGIGRACAAGSPTPCPAGESSAARRRPSGTSRFDGSRGMASEPPDFRAACWIGPAGDPGTAPVRKPARARPDGIRACARRRQFALDPHGSRQPSQVAFWLGAAVAPGNRRELRPEQAGFAHPCDADPFCPLWAGTTLPRERCGTPRPGGCFGLASAGYAVATVDPVGHCDSSGAGITRIT